jgi:membrane protease YdiL (CAAX protease family)
VGVAAVALLGLVFAVMYLRTGSLIAPIVVHFLQDFIAVVVVPLFTNGK